MIALDQVQSIIDALKITLPAQSLPKARAIYKATRRIAREVNRPLPDLAEIFALAAFPMIGSLLMQRYAPYTPNKPLVNMVSLILSHLKRAETPNDAEISIP